MHEALREALANCLINADYFGPRGIVITLLPNKIVFANPGYSRTGKLQMLQGGISDPRNRGLMKMFNLIDIGERAGSGIPKIISIWNDENLKEPLIEELFDPDRMMLTLSLEKKQAIKTSDKFSSYKHGESRGSAIGDKINSAVKSALSKDDWRNDYMTLAMLLQDTRDEGRKEGENLVTSMQQWLLNSGRMQDIQRSILDSDYRKQLLSEFSAANAIS